MAAWDDSTEIWDNAFGVWDAEIHEELIRIGTRSSLVCEAGNVISRSVRLAQTSFLRIFPSLRLTFTTSFRQNATLKTDYKWVFYGEINFKTYNEIDYDVGNRHYLELVMETLADIESPSGSLIIEGDFEFRNESGFSEEYDLTMAEEVEFSNESAYTFYTRSWGREIPVKGDWVPEGTVTGNWTSEKPF